MVGEIGIRSTRPTPIVEGLLHRNTNLPILLISLKQAIEMGLKKGNQDLGCFATFNDFRFNFKRG